MTTTCLRKEKIQDAVGHILIANHVSVALNVLCL